MGCFPTLRAALSEGMATKLLFVVSLFAFNTAWASELPAGDAAAGQSAYVVCATCHGANGEGNLAMNGPRLAGQEPWYLDRQILAYQEGKRGTKPGDLFGMQMRPMAGTLTTPQARANVIAYIQSLNPPPAEQTVEGDAARGQSLYPVCAACHGQQAEGVEALGGPRLAGQNDWYLVRQIESYKKGWRGYHPQDNFGRQMAPMVATLTDEQAIKDVVAYINSLAAE